VFPIQSERKVQSYVSAQNTLGTPEGRSVVHRRAIEQMKRLKTKTTAELGALLPAIAKRLKDKG